MIRAAILLVLAACASSKSAERHAEVGVVAEATAHAEEQSAASGRTTAGPETITTTVEEWASAPETQSETILQAQHSATTQDEPHSRNAIPVLLKRTVTVDQRGPVDSSWMANASGTHGAESQTSLNAASEAHSASKWRVGLPWLSLAALALGLLWAWKAGWLGKGLALLGRIF